MRHSLQSIIKQHVFRHYLPVLLFLVSASLFSSALGQNTALIKSLEDSLNVTADVGKPALYARLAEEWMTANPAKALDNLKKAKAAIKQYPQLGEENFRINMLFAEYYLTKRDYEKIQQSINAAQPLLPRVADTDAAQLWIQCIQGILYIETFQQAQGATMLNQVIEKCKTENLNLALYAAAPLAKYYKDNKQPAETGRILKAIQKLPGSTANTTVLLQLYDLHAEACLTAKRYQEAYEYYTVGLTMASKAGATNEIHRFGAGVKAVQDAATAESLTLKEPAEMAQADTAAILKAAEKERQLHQANADKYTQELMTLIQQGKAKEAIQKLGELKETEEKLNEIKIKDGKMLYLILAGGIVIVVGFVALFALLGMNREKRKANTKLELQQKELKKQYKQLSEQKEMLEQAQKTIEKEREKSDELLLNILPASIADELKEYGMARPKKYVRVSVLFTDFKGFTHSAENMSPEELLQRLDTVFAAFDRITANRNLEKIKTIGDAYMAAGGIPKANLTNPLDCVLAGLEMARYMDATMQQYKEKGRTDYWELRLGIHTGPVVAGVVGTKKFAYDIWGDAVNTAARMESSGQEGQLNISGETYELVKDYFDCTFRGNVAAKNKGEIAMYFVNSIKPELSERGLGIVPNDAFWRKYERFQ